MRENFGIYGALRSATFTTSLIFPMLISALIVLRHHRLAVMPSYLYLHADAHFSHFSHFTIRIHRYS